jgi:hypothetical protein
VNWDRRKAAYERLVLSVSYWISLILLGCAPLVLVSGLIAGDLDWRGALIVVGVFTVAALWHLVCRVQKNQQP